MMKDRIFNILLKKLAVKKVKGKYLIVGRPEAAAQIARLFELALAEKEEL